MRLAPFRRSRVYAFGTWSAFRCPSVPLVQAHCLSLAGENVTASSAQMRHSSVAPSDMVGRTRCGIVGELGFGSPSLTLRTELARRRHTCLLPSSALLAG